MSFDCNIQLWFRSLSVGVLGLSLAVSFPVSAQTSAQKLLLEKAKTLQSHGRDDMAAQVYRQILAADPNNAEAIASLARYYKQMGKDAEANQYLQQLRLLKPGDPNISKIQSLASNQTRDTRLSEAGKLAQQGKSEAAMAIYRSLYGQNPPEGDVALGYYETEYATPGGKAHAVEGLKGLVKRFPGDARYGVALGKVLTYEPKTRAEGIRILGQYPQNAAAQAALRQALLWDVQNPRVQSVAREYLKQHSDSELAEKLKDAEEKTSAISQNSLAISSEEQVAYRALNASRLDEAQQLFAGILQKQHANPRAFAGLGFVAMKANRFADAVEAFEKAIRNGLHTAPVETALTQSRFWLEMGNATTALSQGEHTTAAERYQAALRIYPNNVDALAGLAGVYSAMQQYSDAETLYERCLKAQPKLTLAWRGLFLTQVSSGNIEAALATEAKFPLAVRSELGQDLSYLSSLSVAYRRVGRDAEAAKVLDRALVLPEGKGANGVELQMQRANLLAESKRFDQASDIYRQVLQSQPHNLNAWRGLIDALHQANNDAEALSLAEKMPSEVRESGLRDAAFLQTLSAIYQQQGRLEIARGFLERAVRLQVANGAKLSTSLQLQLASIDMLTGSVDDAYAAYEKVLAANPNYADAWKGMLAAMHQAGRDQEAADEIEKIPSALKNSLELDPEYLQSIAGIYAATGRLRTAVAAMSQVQAHYASQYLAPPADVDVQNAWLLYNLNDDKDLYPVLMRLGKRTDLSSTQKDQVQKVWANWSVRRAGQAYDVGEADKALAILNAATVALSGNHSVTRILAGGYAKIGRAEDALKMYASVNWSQATQADYEGAVGAALAANNKKWAEAWLVSALQRYANDPKILALAARYEQARGNASKAAAYWRASLAATPRSQATDQLAQELASPAPVRRGVPDPRDLASLLNPGGATENASSSYADMPLPGAGNRQPSGRTSASLKAQQDGPSVFDSGSLATRAKTTQPVQESALFEDAGSPLQRAEAALRASMSGAVDVTSPSIATSLAAVQNTPSSIVLPSIRNNSMPVAPVDPIREAQDQLTAIDGSHSGYVGGTGIVTNRSGNNGFDRLAVFEDPMEASAPLGSSGRITVIAKPVFLDAGLADGTSTLQTTNGVVPQPIGTRMDTNNNPPLQQNSFGVGGELQVATSNLSFAVGYTPANFLVENVIGRAQFRPAGGPFTFSFNRDSVKDTQLSYAGLRDPSSISASYAGNVWGGVIANSADIQFAKGFASSGFYMGAGGQYITGKHVQENRRIHGSAGSYWRVLNKPDFGSLNLGANFFGMSYEHNLRALTYGMGGYFSPQAYFLANLPVTWNGHYGRDISYNISGSFGMQAFQEDKSFLFPLDPITLKNMNYIALPTHTSVSGNYDFRGEVAKGLSGHWYVGGFLSLNNARDYASQSAGFFVRYMFRSQALLPMGPTGIVRPEGLRPLIIP